jgi:hypothetical protein
MRQLLNLEKANYHRGGPGAATDMILRLGDRRRAVAKKDRSLAAAGRTARASDRSPSQSMPHCQGRGVHPLRIVTQVRWPPTDGQPVMR